MQTNSIEHLAYEKNQAEKIVKSHGVSSDYSLHAILVVKAVSSGIENPHQWANEMLEMLNNQKIMAL